MRRARAGLRQPPSEHLQPLGSRCSTIARRLTSVPALAQCPHDVSEIALRLAQVVRLGEALAGQRLVGDLGLATASVRVVDTAGPVGSTR